MILLIAIVVILLLVAAGPLRRPLLSVWWISLPAALGACVGLVLGIVMIGRAAPAWIVPVAVLGGALMAIGVLRDWFDDNVDPPGRGK